jgi:hypothetical protein
MSEKSYQIVVTGELVEGSYLPDVKAKLAVLFTTSAEKLDPLFSGKRVVIKKGLGLDAAQKYVAAVVGVGLKCVAEAMVVEAQQAPAPPQAGPSLAPAGSILVETPSVTVPQIDTSAFSVAPVGVTMDESSPVTAPDIDTSNISVAPVGGNLVEHAPPEVPDIDTSALSVAPAGAPLVEAEQVSPPVIDISNLDMAPVGSDMGEKQREDAPPPPDTSHLNLD